MSERIYLITQSHYRIPALFTGSDSDIRPPFRILRSHTLVDDFFGNGSVDSYRRFQRADEWKITRWSTPRSSLQLPRLGPLLLSVRGAARHKFMWGDYGAALWPPEIPTSVDQSLWPIPLVTRTRHRVDCLLPKSEAARSVTARLFVRVFPFGICTCGLAISLTQPTGFSIKDIVALCRMLTGRHRSPSSRATYSMGTTGIAGPAPHFLDQVARLVAERLAQPGKESVIDLESSAVLVLNRTEPLRDDREIAGLLRWEVDYERFREEFATRRSTNFGRYEQDLVVATRHRLLVNMHPAQRLRYPWILTSVMDVANLQRLIAPTVEAVLSIRAAGAADGKADRSRSRLLKLISQLESFGRGLISLDERWYRECAAIHGLDDVHETWVRLVNQERTRMASHGDINVTASGGSIVNIAYKGNLENIQNWVQHIQGPGTEDVRTSLTSVADAIHKDPTLSDDDKKKLLERLEALTESAAKDPEQRKTAIVSDVMAGLHAALSVATIAGKAWAIAEPVLHMFFGI